ncbi:phage head-binding domain-containing protein [Xenorhabdus bovienii]|uniref:phage head-binding domain-containing protein n=1 Tax=Xenorhabdus bovienii TaxID=40576 RepID=UPI0023B32CE3|nr:phage head-binding domain-containing protein [Xenorhabdus bovienii]
MSEITPNVIVSMPSQLFTMARSFKACSNGRIYIGKIDTDPTIPENQIQVYVEHEGSHISVGQPIVINAAGYPVYNGQIAKFVTVEGHSMAVYDSYKVQQFYFPNILKYDPDQFSVWAKENFERSFYKRTGISFKSGGKIWTNHDAVMYEKDGFFYVKKHVDESGCIVLPNSSPNDSWVCIGLLNGYPINSPENFGAISNDEKHDCLTAINFCLKNKSLRLLANSNYYVSDEIIIPSYLDLVCDGQSKITAITDGNWVGKKSVVRASSRPVGETPNPDNINEQVRGLHHSGSLHIDANNVVDYGWYSFYLVAESIIDFIIVRKAKRCGISILGSWYTQFRIGLMSLESAIGITIGYPLSGETGDTNVNATSIPFISAWNIGSNFTDAYDPFSTDIKKQITNAGIILGKSLGNNCGVMSAEQTYGAGLVTANAHGWDISSLYLEICSKSYQSDVDEPQIALLSSTGNKENHSINIGMMHLGARDGILTRSNAEFIIINSIYRYDNSKTWHSTSTDKTCGVNFLNYYALLAYDYIAPNALKRIKDQYINFSGWKVNGWENSIDSYFQYTGDNTDLIIKMTSSGNGAQIRIESDEGDEYYGIFEDYIKSSLKMNRTTGKLYRISASKLSNSTGVGTMILKTSSDQWRPI